MDTILPLPPGHSRADGNLKIFMNLETQQTAQMSPKSFPSREEIKRWVNVAFKQALLPLATKPNPCPLPSGSSIKEYGPWLSRRVRELLGDYDTNVSHSRADGNLNVRQGNDIDT